VITDQLKKQAADYTIDTYVASGMVVGLGYGSTSMLALRRLAEHLESGKLKNIIGVPCAKGTAKEARRLNIPVTTLELHPVLDLTFDGADEVDPQLNLIKGGGGAMLREKIVAQASRTQIIMVDEAKLVPALGTRWSLPVEVLAFGLETQLRYLKSLGGEPVLRRESNGAPYQTDQGNHILDTRFGPMQNPAELAAQLNARAGIIAHGLFLGIATAVVVAGQDGVRVLNRQ
jgi:ribose 5-phosphate isomerase A